MTSSIVTLAAVAVGTLIAGSSGALAQRMAVPETPYPETCMYNCPFETPDPKGDPDPGNPAAEQQSNLFAIGCEVRSSGLVFRNLGDMTVAARTRLQWSTSDGRSGRLTLGVSMEPNSAWLYAAVPAPAKASCAVSAI